MSTRRAVRWFLLFAAYMVMASLIFTFTFPPRAGSPGIYLLVLLVGFLAMLVPPFVVFLRLVKGRKAEWGENLREAERHHPLASMLTTIGLLGFAHLLDGSLRAVGLGAAVGLVNTAGAAIMTFGLAWSWWLMLKAIPEPSEEAPAV